MAPRCLETLAWHSVWLPGSVSVHSLGLFMGLAPARKKSEPLFTLRAVNCPQQKPSEAGEGRLLRENLTREPSGPLLGLPWALPTQYESHLPWRPSSLLSRSRLSLRQEDLPTSGYGLAAPPRLPREHALNTGWFRGAGRALSFAFPFGFVPFPPPYLKWPSGFPFPLRQTGSQKRPGSLH